MRLVQRQQWLVGPVTAALAEAATEPKASLCLCRCRRVERQGIPGSGRPPSLL